MVAQDDESKAPKATKLLSDVCSSQIAGPFWQYTASPKITPAMTSER
jgi:hypothetical protein